MVFWAANPTFADIDEHACQTSLTAECQSAAHLRGFSVGDETTEPVLGIGQVLQPSRSDSGNPAPVTCIGCHSATPDKGFVTFADSYPWHTATASVQGPMGTPPERRVLPDGDCPPASRRCNSPAGGRSRSASTRRPPIRSGSQACGSASGRWV